MTHQQQIFAIIASIGLFYGIIKLVKNEKLKEEYAWLWLLTGLIIFVMVLWYDGLELLTHLIGAALPTTTLFIFGFAFLICLSLHFAIKISILTNQMKTLAQKVSLLEAEKNNPR